ncbi:MAG: exo-alpha-sialidase [Clostridia bacterium]|nr:exo-alpha-sialidase [Clostridia bacterium]
MKIKLIGDTCVIMSNPDSYHKYFAWPTVTRLQNGKIAVVASGFRLSHVCPFGKTVISYSEDEGKTYTFPAPVIDTVLDDRDGGILAYGDKNVIVTSFNNTPDFQKERIEHGKGFSKHCPMKPYRYAYLDSISEEEVDKYYGALFRISSDCGVTFGEMFKSPVTSPHGPTVLSDGSLLWVGTNFQDINKNNCKTPRLSAYRIHSNGKTEHVGDIENFCNDNGKIVLSCEPYATEISSGRILCHIRAQIAGDSAITLYQTHSDDKGKTWSKPERILPENGGAPSHILKHSSGVLVCTYGCRKKPFGIKAMISRNNGENWEDLGYIYENEYSADLGYPSTVELNDKSLATVFYAHSEQNGPAVIMQQKWNFI